MSLLSVSRAQASVSRLAPLRWHVNLGATLLCWMEFDPVSGHAYNASHHGLGPIIACLKERERTWLFLKD
jgi:hypothetical protein